MDIEQRKVMWDHNHQGKKILAPFCKALDPPGCQPIKGVAGGGAQGFLSATQEYAPQALIILYPFHVKTYLLLQNKVSSKQQNLLDQLAGLNETAAEARLLKDQSLYVYQAPNWKTARTNLRAWIVAAIRSQIPAFVEPGFKFFRKRLFVLNYFRPKIHPYCGLLNPRLQP